jgi:zinc transporter
MEREDGLIAAYILDGRGGGKPIDWEEIARWSPGDGLLWVHLDYKGAKAREWISEHSGRNSIAAEVLLAEETRPRTVSLDNGLLVTLRGMNLNPRADPEDMVSIRVWATEHCIISTRKRRLLSVDDLRKQIDGGAGPATAGDFLVELSARLAERMASVIDGIDEAVDDLEDAVVTKESHKLRSELAGVRRQAISIRRYLSPQRDAMARLHAEKVSWLTEENRFRLREITDRITRYVEDLDMARDRAAVTQEELVSRLSEEMDKRMYLLSIVAAVFLPLGFLTGLLGINVGGIPGAEYHWGFAIVFLLLLALSVALLYVLKRKSWI